MNVPYFLTLLSRESDAILIYITDKYDKERRISSADENERYQIIQWLFFQASGQGYVLFEFAVLSRRPL